MLYQIEKWDFENKVMITIKHLQIKQNLASYSA